MSYSELFQLNTNDVARIKNQKFNYQVAGHANIQSLLFPVTLLPSFWKARSSSAVATTSDVLLPNSQIDVVDVAVKPTTWKEAQFYMDLLLSDEPVGSSFSRWIPRFYGYSPIPSGVDEPVNVSEKPSGDRKVLVYLENLTPAHSNDALAIVDIKLGWRHYDNEASTAKREKMIRLVQETSSKSYGIRITGSMVMSTAACDKRDKHFFKPILDFEQIKRIFLVDILRQQLTTADKEYVCSQLELMKSCLGNVCLYSTSMLFIFDESASCQEKRIKLYWVDFAHSYVNKSMSEWELEGVLTGLASLMRVFSP